MEESEKREVCKNDITVCGVNEKSVGIRRANTYMGEKREERV